MSGLLPVRRRQIKPADVTRHPSNARTHDIDAIRASIRELGWWGEVAVQASTGYVIAGNGRHEAAELEGLAKIPAAFYDVDDALARKIVLADNRTSDLAGYDNDRLAELLKAATLDPAGLAGTGYTERDLADLLDGIDKDAAAAALNDADEIPPTPARPRSKAGDTWLLGPHRVRCGDATDPAELEALLAGSTVQALLTDPPYNVAYEGKTKARLTITNDEMWSETFYAFLVDAFTAAAAHLDAGAGAYVFHAEGDGRGSTFRLAFVEAGLELKQCLVWVKNTFVLGRQDYHWQHEPILYGWKPGAAHRWFGNRNKSTLVDDELDIEAMTKDELLELVRATRATSSVLREPRPNANAAHPTMKPVRLLERLLSNSTAKGDTVLDPFGGSGSTLIAAHGTGRTAALLELDPRYVDVICRRYQEHTGTLPQLERTGRTRNFVEV